MTFFDYFQIASVIIFLTIVVTRIIYLRTKSINAIAIGRGKTGLAFIVELLSFVGLATWVVEIFLYALHSNFHFFPAAFHASLIDSIVAKTIGAILITVGLGIFIGAFISFGDSWRIGFDVKKPGGLVTTGMFSVTRNPIYVFLDLWFIGIFLINGTLVFLIFAVLAVFAIHWQILQEEAFLRKLYGKPYQDYCARTGRYA